MAFKHVSKLLRRSTVYAQRLRQYQPAYQPSEPTKMQHAANANGAGCLNKTSQAGGCKHNDGLTHLLQANRQWAAEMRASDPDFFNRLVSQQNPEYLWIGCSDSRVPANQILGLAPGEIFVQRNVGNQAMHTDMNLMSCLEYAVKSLKVKTIILCGHYNCGAVKAALQLPHTTPGLVNCWISDIRECRNQAEKELRGLDAEQQLARLCELNVLRQVFHVATSPVVAGAWAEGQELHLYGVIYDLADGHLRKLAGPISGDEGYEHSLEGFVMEGLQVTRCPQTSMLRVNNTTSTDTEQDPLAQYEPNMVAADGDMLYPLPLLSTPSELVSSINNINLRESIAKHKQWAQGGVEVQRSQSGGSSPSSQQQAAGDEHHQHHDDDDSTMNHPLQHHDGGYPVLVGAAAAAGAQ